MRKVANPADELVSKVESWTGRELDALSASLHTSVWLKDSYRKPTINIIRNSYSLSILGEDYFFSSKELRDSLVGLLKANVIAELKEGWGEDGEGKPINPRLLSRAVCFVVNHMRVLYRNSKLCAETLEMNAVEEGFIDCIVIVAQKKLILRFSDEGTSNLLTYYGYSSVGRNDTFKGKLELDGNYYQRFVGWLEELILEEDGYFNL